MQRFVDELGRICIPKELRERLNIKSKDKVVFSIKDNKLILEKEDLNLESEDVLL